MPLPADLLTCIDHLKVQVDGRGAWEAGAWEGDDIVQAFWVLPLGALSSENDAPTPSRLDVENRLAQARIDWRPAVLEIRGETIQGLALESITRAKAIALGYRLRRWAVFKIGSDGLSVAYTGLGSRVDA